MPVYPNRQCLEHPQPRRRRWCCLSLATAVRRAVGHCLAYPSLCVAEYRSFKKTYFLVVLHNVVS